MHSIKTSIDFSMENGAWTEYNNGVSAHGISSRDVTALYAQKIELNNKVLLYCQKQIQLCNDNQELFEFLSVIPEQLRWIHHNHMFHINVYSQDQAIIEMIHEIEDLFFKDFAFPIQLNNARYAGGVRCKMFDIDICMGQDDDQYFLDQLLYEISIKFSGNYTPIFSEKLETQSVIVSDFTADIQSRLDIALLIMDDNIGPRIERDILRSDNMSEILRSIFQLRHFFAAINGLDDSFSHNWKDKNFIIIWFRILYQILDKPDSQLVNTLIQLQKYQQASRSQKLHTIQEEEIYRHPSAFGSEKKILGDQLATRLVIEWSHEPSLQSHVSTLLNNILETAEKHLYKIDTKKNIL